MNMEKELVNSTTNWEGVEAAYIVEIRTAHDIITNHLDINNQFKKFCKELYTSESRDKTEINAFLDKWELPTINE